MKYLFVIYFFLIFSYFSGYSKFSSANSPNEIPSVTEYPWQEVVISVSNLERASNFFTEIGKYIVLHKGEVLGETLKYYGLTRDFSAQEVLIKERDSSHGFIRLINFNSERNKIPMRPGARAWDTGCFFSVMLRMRGMDQIYKDAINLGWWTETPIINYSAFGSNLKIVIFKGPGGIQVSGYERLSPPLPSEFEGLEVFSQPFNIMQTVKDAEVAKKFYMDILGFKLWYDGKAFTGKEKALHPLGIPYSLTNSTRYKAKILFPSKGEFGRVEMVEFMDLEGLDYSKSCDAPNLGLLSIKFPVKNIMESRKVILNRKPDLNLDIQSINIAPYGDIQIISLKTPDGANIEIYE